MEFKFELLPGGVNYPKGFLAEGVFCDIKRIGTGKGSNKGKKLDLAVIFSEEEATTAGAFTTNQIKAAPVRLCLKRMANQSGRAIVVNSGNANACTGVKGTDNALAMARATAKELHINTEDVWVCSTGRIGVQLPMAHVRKGIHSACTQLGDSIAHATRAAEAILTSDNHTKQLAAQMDLDGCPARIGGMTKGAGMIAPGMSANGERPALHATMLCFLTTDLSIAPDCLQLALEKAVAQSFNRISIDGDMSTNDSVILMANGMAGNTRVTKPRGKVFELFQAALNELTRTLAKQMVCDGEGVSRCVNLHLQGARTPLDAEAAVRSVSNSELVKTSWCGGDPNWGRIMDALGYSTAKVDGDRVDIGYRESQGKRILYVLKNGVPTRTPLSAVRKITEQAEFDILIDLHLGKSSTVFYTADLTEAYVDFNKGE